MPEMKPGIKITSYHTKQKTQIWDQDLESGINPKGKRDVCGEGSCFFILDFDLSFGVWKFTRLDSSRVLDWFDWISHFHLTVLTVFKGHSEVDSLTIRDYCCELLLAASDESTVFVRQATRNRQKPQQLWQCLQLRHSTSVIWAKFLSLRSFSAMHLRREEIFL